jgi:flagellar basal body-associated protein FliL
MANTTEQKNDHTMKHIVFIILGAVTVMCLVLATGYFQP